MKLNLSHPLWTHIPSVASLAVLIVALVSAGALPVDAPVHYGPGGQPDRYGSPWAAFALIVGLSIGFIILSVWLDELWARQERTKTFNYFALLDDITVGPWPVKDWATCAWSNRLNTNAGNAVVHCSRGGRRAGA